MEVSRLDDLAERAHDSLEAAIDKITPAAHSILQRLRSLDAKPDEICLQFGVKLSASAGAFIASAASEANFQLSLKWSRSKRNAGDVEADPAPASEELERPADRG